MTNVTRALAAFSTNLRFSDLPDTVIHEAKRSLLHWIGCAVGGSHEASVDRALAAISSFSGPAQSTVLGRSERLDLLHTAFINGISTDVLSFSDTHPETLIHPTGVVGPAILGLAECEKVSGEELLVALVVGFEVASRVGYAVYPWHYNRGWHITGTAGVFGAAAAAARLMRLSEDQVTWAFGIAATAAAGLRGMFGSMCKNFHSGRAAENGLLAVHLAKVDFNSVEDGIGGPRCFAHVLGESPNLDRVVKDLGVTYEISKNTYKAYPCGIVIHPVIDACIEVRRHAEFKAEDVLEIEIIANPYVIELTGKESPITTLEGKLSVFHSAAAALVAGRVGEQEYEPAFIARRDVIALREKVKVKVKPDMREDEARVKVIMAGVEAIEVYVPHAKGTIDRPLTDKDIETKFMGLCEPYLPQENIKKLIDLCWNLTTCSHAEELARLGSAASPSK